MANGIKVLKSDVVVPRYTVEGANFDVADYLQRELGRQFGAYMAEHLRSLPVELTREDTATDIKYSMEAILISRETLDRLLRGESVVKIEIYVKGELEMTCYNEFVAMNNVATLRKQHGKENVIVRRIEGGY